MTRDEILHMEAGREMDALIAEKVMGWTWVKLPVFPKNPLRPANLNKARGLCGPCGNAPADFKEPIATTDYVHPYSTDIAAAWEVADKLGIAIGKKDVGVYFAVESDLRANVEFWWDDDPEMHCNCAYAETPALAICRAALLATMEAE